MNMETTEQIKEMVREKYSTIALQDKADNESSCCGSAESSGAEPAGTGPVTATGQ